MMVKFKDYKGHDVEKVHIKFCNRVLGVRENTCNSAVHYELGIFLRETSKNNNK